MVFRLMIVHCVGTNRLHQGPLVVIDLYFYRRKIFPPYCPAPSSSMRGADCGFAILSLRLAEPVLIRPQFSATAVSAIVVSSVSPLWWNHHRGISARCAISTALMVSVRDPIWFTLPDGIGNIFFNAFCWVVFKVQKDHPPVEFFLPVAQLFFLQPTSHLRHSVQYWRSDIFAPVQQNSTISSEESFSPSDFWI